MLNIATDPFLIASLINFFLNFLLLFIANIESFFTDLELEKISTWKKVENTVFESDLKSVFFIDKNNGWAVGARGLIVATTDGGQSWEPQTSKVDNGLSDVCFLTPKTGFVAGEGETVLKTTNGGKKWTILSGGSQASGFGDDDTSVFSAIQFVDENTD